MLSPGYELDMHCAAGTVGYGRIAVVKDGSAIWLDEFANVEAVYYHGGVRFVCRTSGFAISRFIWHSLPDAELMDLLSDWIHLHRSGTSRYLAGLSENKNPVNAEVRDPHLQDK